MPPPTHNALSGLFGLFGGMRASGRSCPKAKSAWRGLCREMRDSSIAISSRPFARGRCWRGRENQLSARPRGSVRATASSAMDVPRLVVLQTNANHRPLLRRSSSSMAAQAAQLSARPRGSVRATEAATHFTLRDEPSTIELQGSSAEWNYNSAVKVTFKGMMLNCTTNLPTPCLWQATPPAEVRFFFGITFFRETSTDKKLEFASAPPGHQTPSSAWWRDAGCRPSNYREILRNGIAIPLWR